jgi:hypothetical protein
MDHTIVISKKLEEIKWLDNYAPLKHLPTLTQTVSSGIHATFCNGPCYAEA